jgi:hypothetical protein
MRTTLVRRVALGALALLTTLTVVAPVQAREPLRKIEPRRTVPYRVGRAFTPNTDVLSVSGYAAWMIDEALGLTTPLPRLGAAFMRAEREEGINARYFVAHAMLESGWGTSAIATYKRNLFGYNAYDRDPWKYARRFSSHARGVAIVAEILRESYLTPGGPRWYGFTTLRGINRYYASDVHWADKVAVLANVIDYLVVTLRERGLRFHRPVLVDQPIVGAPAALDIPWTANPGAQVPDGLRFAIRWTPLAVVEASADAPAAAPTAPWQLARRTEGPDHVVRLALQPPILPGLWRLDVEARDSDGRPLPKTDRPVIRGLDLRVAAPGEVAVALSVGDDAGLAATVSVAGVGPVGAPAASGERDRADDVAGAGAADGAAPSPSTGARATLEVWTLPLDPALSPYLQASVPLPDMIAPGMSWTVPVGTPAIPAVVVGRVVVPGAVVAALPTVALADRGDDGRLVLRPLAVASPRDELLLARPPAASALTTALTPRPGVEPGSVEVAVSAGDPAPALDAAVAGVEETPGPHSVLVRTLSVDAGSLATPTGSLVTLPVDATGATRIVLGGIPAGVRLVMTGLVPRDGGPIDPATISLAWIAVTATSLTGAAPN